MPSLYDNHPAEIYIYIYIYIYICTYVYVCGYISLYIFVLIFLLFEKIKFLIFLFYLLQNIWKLVPHQFLNRMIYFKTFAPGINIINRNKSNKKRSLLLFLLFYRNKSLSWFHFGYFVTCYIEEVSCCHLVPNQNHLLLIIVLI